MRKPSPVDTEDDYDDEDRLDDLHLLIEQEEWEMMNER